MTDRKQTDYKKLVGRTGDEYFFIDYSFEHSEDFKGTTGSVMRPVSRQEYEDRTSEENMRDYLKDSWQAAVESGRYEESLDDYLEEIEPDEMFDQSYPEYAEQLREKFPEFTEEDYPIIECIGGGRCFSKGMKFDEVYSPELVKVINKFEREEKTK